MARTDDGHNLRRFWAVTLLAQASSGAVKTALVIADKINAALTVFVAPPSRLIVTVAIEDRGILRRRASNIMGVLYSDQIGLYEAINHNLLRSDPMRRFALAAVLTVSSLSFGAVTTAATAHEASSKGVTVAHPWVRANPGGTTLTAGYMEIKTDAGTTDRLVGVSTSAAARSEIHTHEMDGDVMRMRKVDGLDLKAGTSTVLRPSGDHLMLMDLKAPLKEGDLVKLQLQFEKAGSIEIEATVEPVGAMGPHGMDHQPGAEDEGGHEGHMQHEGHDSGSKHAH